jgi:hypothetical protein
MEMEMLNKMWMVYELRKLYRSMKNHQALALYFSTWWQNAIAILQVLRNLYGGS